MEHREVEELLELAAVEPAGFERLMAGDTPEAAAVAGHLAGCPSCALAFEHLRGVASELRDLVAELPAEDLRERTLARIAAEGRVREAATAAPVEGPVEPQPATGPVVEGTPRTGRTRAPWPWVAAAAAAVVVAVVGLAGWWLTAGQLGSSQATVATFVEMTEATAEIAAMPDARTVGLAGQGSAGWLTFSAATTQVAVQAEGLPEPGPGQEYRCWVEIDGARTVIGPMWVDGAMSWWVGPAAEVAAVGPGTIFGVSLVDVDAGQPGQPVLTGELGGS